MIKTSDWIVDMGPEGGSGGGTVVATGTPEEVAANLESYTGHFLAEIARRGAAETAPELAAVARSAPRATRR